MSAGKIKLDDYDIRIVISGLTQCREMVSNEGIDVIDPLHLRLIKSPQRLLPVF